MENFKVDAVKQNFSDGKKCFYYTIHEHNGEREYDFKTFAWGDTIEQAKGNAWDYISEWYADATPSEQERDDWFESGCGEVMWTMGEGQEVKTVDELLEQFI
jgi:hypothetical protein